jgi:hypothetical protein
VSDPFCIFDTSDWRSVSENGLFKEGKHPWHLFGKRKRTEAAVVVHCPFPLRVMGMTTAFRVWQAHCASTPTPATEILPSFHATLLGGEGTARWRQRVREENRDTIIVFIRQAPGMFHLAEYAVLTAVPIHHLLSLPGSPQAVLQRFGISPSSFSQNIREYFLSP